MSTTTTSPPASYVQWLIESRPPSLTWSGSSAPQTNQPPLDLIDHKFDVAEVAAPDNSANGAFLTASTIPVHSKSKTPAP
jgi:hypothetical protein